MGKIRPIIAQIGGKVFDTIHLGIPNGNTYTKAYLKARSNLSTETERKAIKKGRDYDHVIDLRYIDVPALLHVNNVHDWKAGDKFEFIGAGSLGLSEIVGYVREIYLMDAPECDIMRIDPAGDLEGSFVPWCRENVRVSGKQCVQLESPTKSFREVSQRRFETIYWGRGDTQNKAYDKTGERIWMLQKKRRKMTREERSAISLEDHFFREYGYPIFKPVTRFECRVGGRQSGEVYGISKLGEIEKYAFIDPFERWEFPEQAHNKDPGRIPRGMDIFSIMYLRDLVERDGLTNARNAMMRAWGTGSSFYRRYNAILPLLLDLGTGLGREQVRKAYVESTLKQLAA